MSAATYHHGNLRAALVDAATGAARAGGPEALVLRTLAREVGVSHNAAYRHFADRSALVEEVAERGLVELVAAMKRRFEAVDAADPDADPVRRARLRLGAAGRGYIDFALAQPGLFRTVFTAFPVPPDDPADAPEPGPYGLLNGALDDLVTVGFLAPEHRAGADVMCWSAVHGFSVLSIEGPLRGLPEGVREGVIEHTITAIDRSYGATTGHLDPL